MAEIIKNSDLILGWIKEKQTNEQMMLAQLNELFKQNIPTRMIRRVVLLAFEQMVHEINNFQTAKYALGAVVDEEKLAVWSTLEQHTTIPHFRIVRMHKKLINWYYSPPVLDINDFSELMRVIATWIEKGGGFRAPEINKAYRMGIGKIKAPDSPSQAYLSYLGMLRRKYGWQYHDMMNSKEREELAKLITTGDYIGRQNARDEKSWSSNISRQREEKQKIPHQIEEHVADFWVRPKFGTLSGMQMFRANRNDLCKKIDLLFGFIIGATISGTTTDTVMVLESFGSQMKPPLHAGYYLFPVATIAASLHHSLLEAGLALTVTDCIDSYCAGFYTTLIPKGGLPGELKAAEKILKDAEESDANRHLLIWYNGNEKLPVGCIHWNKPYEIKQYKRLVEGKGLLTHINTMPEVPDKMAIMRLMKVMAPGLFAYLPEELQLR